MLGLVYHIYHTSVDTTTHPCLFRQLIATISARKKLKHNTSVVHNTGNDDYSKYNTIHSRTIAARL